MLFNLKSIVIYGLLVVVTASPLASIPGRDDVATVKIEARTKKKGVPQSFKLLDGGTVSRETIAKALGEVRSARPLPETQWPVGMKHFQNTKAAIGERKKSGKVFPDKPMGADSGLLEY